MKTGRFGGFDIIQSSRDNIVTIRINNRGEDYKPLVCEHEETGEAMIMCFTVHEIESVKKELLGLIDVLDDFIKE